jgi:hypothetical protein
MSIKVSSMVSNSKVSQEIMEKQISIWELYSAETTNNTLLSKILVSLDYGLMPQYHMPED